MLHGGSKAMYSEESNPRSLLREAYSEGAYAEVPTQRSALHSEGTTPERLLRDTYSKAVPPKSAYS